MEDGQSGVSGLGVIQIVAWGRKFTTDSALTLPLIMEVPHVMVALKPQKAAMGQHVLVCMNFVYIFLHCIIIINT